MLWFADAIYKLNKRSSTTCGVASALFSKP